MPCYFICGHRGSGKSLWAVKQAREYLARDCRVASNLTLQLDQMFQFRSKVTYTKLPGFPRASDCEALGRAYEGPYNEKRFGLGIFDEAGSWLNAQDWNDAGTKAERRGMFRWFTQSRKFGWDLALIIQDWESLDAQSRRSLLDIYVSANCLGRIKIPFTPFHLPSIHRYVGRYKGPNGLKSFTENLRGIDVRKWYDTQEQITMDETITPDGDFVDARGSYQALSPWHQHGRYLPPKPTRLDWLAFVIRWAIVYPVAMTKGSASIDEARKLMREDFLLLAPGHDLEKAKLVFAERKELQQLQRQASRSVPFVADLATYNRLALGWEQ